VIYRTENVGVNHYSTKADSARETAGMQSNSLTNRDFANGDTKSKLDPWYVTGLADGEGNFSINITIRKDRSTPGVKKISFAFKVTQSAPNAGILYDLLRYFGVGSVVIDNRSDNTLKYHVQNQSDLLNVIIPHFLAYPLVTCKRLNFEDFKSALEMQAGLRSPLTGTTVVNSIEQLKAAMNKERSFEDKFNSVSVKVLDPQWVLAFADGEGLFYVYTGIKNSRRN
jgi:hypothetical protein